MTERKICYVCKSDYDPNSSDYNTDIKQLSFKQNTYDICPRCSNMVAVIRYMFDDDAGTLREILKCHHQVLKGNNAAIQKIIEHLNR